MPMEPLFDGLGKKTLSLVDRHEERRVLRGGEGELFTKFERRMQVCLWVIGQDDRGAKKESGGQVDIYKGRAQDTCFGEKKGLSLYQQKEIVIKGK